MKAPRVVPDDYEEMFPEPTDEQRAMGMICGHCTKCLVAGKSPLVYPFRTVMVLCLACGNKRCPAASDCTEPCTNSNEPGQVGSDYGPKRTTSATRKDEP